MKKTLSALLLIFMLLLTACGGETPSSVTSIHVDAPSVIQNASAGSAKDDSGSGSFEDSSGGTPFDITADLKLVSSLFPSNMSLATENGFYEISPIYPDSLSILQTNFDTKATTFLSGRGEGPYDSEDDTSYISHWFGGAEPFVIGQNLYYRKFAVTHDAETFTEQGEEALGYIAKMDLDSGNHTKLITLAENEIFDINSPLASDGKTLFVMIQQHDGTSERSRMTHVIAAISLQDGSRQDLVSLPVGYLYGLSGAHRDTIAMLRLETGEADPDARGFDEMWQLQDGQKYQLITYSLSTGQQKVVKEWTQNDLQGLFAGNYYAYWDFRDNTFHRFDFMTGEDTTIASNLPSLDPRSSVISSIYDDHAIMETTFEGQNGTEMHNYSIDINTGDFGECRLAWAVIETELGNEVHFVHPLVETAEHFVVYVSPEAGENAEYALIKKSDFWAGIGNYEFIAPAYRTAPAA